MGNFGTLSVEETIAGREKEAVQWLGKRPMLSTNWSEWTSPVHSELKRARAPPAHARRENQASEPRADDNPATTAPR